jgi:hypothetical protein
MTMQAEARFTVLFQSVPLSRSSYTGQWDSVGRTVPDQAGSGKPSKVILQRTSKGFYIKQCQSAEWLQMKTASHLPFT